MLNLFKKLFSPAEKMQAERNSNKPAHAKLAQTTETNQSATELERGNKHLADGDLSNAARHYHQAISSNPNYAEAYLNLGFVLKELQQYDQAEANLQRALQLSPESFDAHYLLGVVAQKLGEQTVAIEHFQNALRLKPNFEIVFGDLCLVLYQSGQFDSAKEIIKKALALNSLNPQFHFYQGNLFYHEERLEQALASFQTALELQPDFLHAYTNMSKVLLKMGDSAGALRCYEKAISINPTTIHEDSLSSDPEMLEIEGCRLFINAYYSNMAPDLYFTMAKHYGKNIAQLAKPYTQWSVYPAGPSLKPLRIGLVSGDFNNHPVAYFLASALAHRNPELVEFIAYPSSPLEDSITAGLKPYFAAWEPITALSNEAAACKIHADGIHILVDLAGHTSHQRLPIFAWKPAPVQVSWLGYLASTGVSEIDYVLADPISAPESMQHFFTETIWHLPETVNCLAPPPPNPQLDVAPTPALHNGYVTFGSFQNLSKINDTVLALWGKILQAIPDARLRLQIKQMSSDPDRDQLLLRLTEACIPTERVQLAGAINSREDYLATHNEVDIILDTFPCPGITTTCEALWMGVPTLTLAGNTLLSRQGASLLNCVGLSDWIAQNENDYIERAILHSKHFEQLDQLRAELRARVLASPLFDAPRFAAHLQNAFQEMWQLRMGK